MTVGATAVNLVEYTAPQTGRYLLMAVLRQEGATTAGCVTSMQIVKNGTVVANVGIPTIKNYAGNEQVAASINNIVINLL